MKYFSFPLPPHSLWGQTASYECVDVIVNYCFNISRRSTSERLCLGVPWPLEGAFPRSSMLGCPAADKLLASPECCHGHVTCAQPPDRVGGQCQACCLPATSGHCPASQQSPGDQEARAFLALFQYCLGSAVPSPVGEEDQHSLCRNTCKQFSPTKILIPAGGDCRGCCVCCSFSSI